MIYLLKQKKSPKCDEINPAKIRKKFSYFFNFTLSVKKKKLELLSVPHQITNTTKTSIKSAPYVHKKVV